MNWTLLYIITAAIVAFLGWLDILAFMVKKTPKRAIFAQWFWLLTVASTIYLAYMYFNSHPFNL